MPETLFCSECRKAGAKHNWYIFDIVVCTLCCDCDPDCKGPEDCRCNQAEIIVE